MQIKFLLTYVFVINTLFCSSVQCHSLLIEAKEQHVFYSFNGNSTPLGKLLDLASDLYKKEHRGLIIIVFDSSIPLDIPLNASGIFNKAGFQKVTLFTLWKKTGRMCELRLGSPVPFKKNPESKNK